MGSGFLMTSYIYNLKPIWSKKILETLGTEFLIQAFSDSDFEDFFTHDKRVADIIRDVAYQEFEKDFEKGYPFSVDVIPVSNGYKIGFFK